MSTEGKVITCKAAVVWELNRPSPFSIETVDVQPPGPEEVRVKIVAVGLCHTDISSAEGCFASLQCVPFVTGHEGAGIVESIGEKVTSVKPGDKVLTGCLPYCGKCQTCLDGMTNVCMDTGRTNRIVEAPFLRVLGYDGKPKFYCKGQPVYTYVGCSSFSEYTVIPENSCIKVDPRAPLEKVCLMTCGFSTGYGSSTHVVNIKSGNFTGVWGLGGVGLACVMGCKDKESSTIIGIDTNPERETVARKLGCTDFVCPIDTGTPIQDILKEKTNGGLHFAFVCVGNLKALESAIYSLRPGGTAVLVGVPPSTNVSFDYKSLFYAVHVTGALLGGYIGQKHIPNLVLRHIEGNLPLDEFITGYFKLEDINDAAKLMNDGKAIRSVFLL